MSPPGKGRAIDDVERVRPFADFLREQAGGHLHDELSEALRDLVGAVAQTNKGGKLTLTISVKPMPKVAGAVLVEDTVKLAAPQLDRRNGVFFITPDNNLVRDNPAQPTLPLTGLRGGADTDARDDAAGGNA